MKLVASDGASSGVIDIPAQGAFDIPLGEIQVAGEEIRFRMAGVPGDPEFHGVLNGSNIEGDFTQGGVTFPFHVALESTSGDQAAVSTVSEGVYVDPFGRYTVPVPTGWSVAAGEDLVVLTDPEQGMRLGISVVDNAEVEEAVVEAWSRFDPSFDRKPYQILDLPAEQGIERSVLVNYDGGDRIYQAAVLVYEGASYILLVDADLAAVQRRAAQLQIVSTGLEITGLEEADLTGAPLRAVAEIEAELEAFIEQNLKAFGIPGAAVGIVQGGEVVYLKGFGVKEAGGTEPITPDTHMMIGSTGKTMTTMLMAVLVDEGLLDWEAPVVEVLPEFAVADPQLTETMAVRHLVCACTGVPRRDLEMAFHYNDLTAEDIVASLRSFEFFTGFGEAFQYSNQLVATGGYVAAAADGARFGELFGGYNSSLTRRVLRPIGLSDTTLFLDDVLARGEYAIPHYLALETGEYTPLDINTERLLTPVAPAGAHWSTARDMTRYLLTQLNGGVAPDGSRIVSTENLHATWEPQVPISAMESYGLGWMTGEYKGLRVVHHGGNTLGFTSDFAFLPEAGLGVVVLTNAQGSNLFNVAVRTRLLELVYGVESEIEKSIDFLLAQTEASFAELQALMQERTDAEAVEPFLGRYSNDALGEITLLFEDEQLVMDVGEFRSPMRPIVDRHGRPDGYVALAAEISTLPMKLDYDEEGNPVVYLGAGAYTFLRVE